MVLLAHGSARQTASRSVQTFLQGSSVCSTDRQTDRQTTTDRATCVTIGRIYAIPCGVTTEACVTQLWWGVGAMHSVVAWRLLQQRCMYSYCTVYECRRRRLEARKHRLTLTWRTWTVRVVNYVRARRPPANFSAARNDIRSTSFESISNKANSVICMRTCYSAA